VADSDGAPAIDLRGKVALVTGASRGIGCAIATVYARAGASVMFSSRKQEALDEVVSGLPGLDVAAFAANAGEPEDARACIEATVERFGAVDILVNNAGANVHFGLVVDATLEQWDKNFRVNLRGPFVWMQEAWRASMRDRGGVVINVISAGGIRADGPIGIYNTTKAGLLHLTQVLAAELGPGVRVNALAPGLVRTEFARALWEGREDTVAAELPLQRLGAPEDLVGAALFLASDLSAWMTGQVVVVDGGSIIRYRRGF